jgi:NADH-quinone oxidoreductase subunit J
VVVGFLQIIVYAGAIMVLFLFVIWLLNLQAEIGPTGHVVLKVFGSLGAAALATELFLFLGAPHLEVKIFHQPAGYGSLASLANTLFTDYLVSFEVTSVLLLAAIVGSVALARRIPNEAGEGSSDPRAAGVIRDAAVATAAASRRVQG